MHENTSDDRDTTVEFQEGVTGRQQALRTGLSRDAVGRKVRSGQWRRLRRGVYATFTGPPSRQAELWAALLQAGPGAALSHYTAAEVWGLTDQRHDQIHVTVPLTRNPARQRTGDGLIVHRSRRIEQARHPSVLPPRTRLEDTVLDLVEIARDFDEAYAWIARAIGRRRTTAPRLAAAAAARKKLRWRAEITAALTDVADGIHSLLERRYVTGVERAHRLPQAIRQAKRRQTLNGVRTTYIDNLYEEFQLCVEVDGNAAHPADQRWDDIRRDNANAARGSVTLRFSWTDVTQHRCQSAMLVGATLRARGWTGALQPCSPACPIAHS